MDKIQITLRNDEIIIVPIINKERFMDYVESKNDKRVRWWVSEKLAINLDLIHKIELIEGDAETHIMKVDESELDF